MKINTFAKALFGAVVLTLCATSASAIPITDSVNPTDTLITLGSTPSPCPGGFTCTTSSLSFFHDLTDDGFVAGPGTIASATITIHLMDSHGGGSEKGYEYDIGTVPQTFTGNNVSGGNGNTDVITLNAASLADLESDGRIKVTITSRDGGFLFADSVLTAQDPPGISSVPEPSSLLLVSTMLGVLGLGLTRRV